MAIIAIIDSESIGVPFQIVILVIDQENPQNHSSQTPDPDIQIFPQNMYVQSYLVLMQRSERCSLLSLYGFVCNFSCLLDDALGLRLRQI